MAIGFIPTLVVLACGVIAFAWATIAARRPYEIGQSPWRFHGAVQFIALVVVFLMLAHLITLTTGEPFKGRRIGY
ncbi:MAG: hypothetical protein AAGF15_00560 [Pseudomonadota bacterium]